MHLKRYLFTIVLYYTTGVLSALWLGASGYQLTEAYVLAHLLAAVLYVVMSLYLVVLNPPKQFAFDSTPRRILRWVVYLSLYFGVVSLSPLQFLHLGSNLVYFTLAAPCLLFLGMLRKPKKDWKDAKENEDEDEDEALYPKPPLARGLYYSLFYFIAFTGLAALLKGPFDDSSVPNQYRPILFSMIMAVPFLLMTLMLTVIRPNKPFDFASRSGRLVRFSIYIGLFVLFSIMLPFFPANHGSELSWLAGIVPLCLFWFMAAPARARIRPVSVPKTTDSFWRGLKYSAVFTLVQLVAAVVLIGVLFSLKEGIPLTEFLKRTMFIAAPLIVLLVGAMLYRLIVIKPHSRFRAMPKRLRYRRWLNYMSTYFAIQVIGPMAVMQFWQWDYNFDYSLMLAAVLFQSAAFGSDAAPTWKSGTRPPAEPPGEAVRRRLTELSRSAPTQYL